MNTQTMAQTDGVGRNVLEARLRQAAHELEELQAKVTWGAESSREYIDCLRVMATERIQLLDQVRSVQARCTELLDGIRGCRLIARSPPSELHALGHLAHERRQQDAKWGPLETLLDVPDGTGVCSHQEIERENARAVCDTAFARGTGTWADVLREEVAEVLAESDTKRLRAELVQVGALAVKWIEILDKRTAREEAPGEVPARNCSPRLSTK